MLPSETAERDHRIPYAGNPIYEYLAKLSGDARDIRVDLNTAELLRQYESGEALV